MQYSIMKKMWKDETHENIGGLVLEYFMVYLR